MSDQTDIADGLEYMRACIRAHSPRDVEHWDHETLRSVFSTLPQKFIGFDDWRIKTRRAIAAPVSAPAAAPAQVPQPAASPLFATPEQAAQNEAALAALASDFPDLKDRLADEAAAAKAAQSPQS